MHPPSHVSVRPSAPFVERRRKPRAARSLPLLQEMDLEHGKLVAWRTLMHAMPPCEKTATNGSGCTHAANGGCARQVLRLAEDMLFFLSEHFALEDETMHRGCSPTERNEAFDRHQEDHGTIMHELVEWLGDPSPCRQRGAMQALLKGRFARHIDTHDAVLKRILLGD